MKTLLTAFCLSAAFSAPAQTLFTYGKQAVSANEFLRAFQKNNQAPVTEKSLKEYLELYINSRLKIEEARERRYDTLPQLVADLANLRQQILPNYLNDKESMDKMVPEAFGRLQKDLHLAHIFIKIGDNPAAAAQKKAQVVLALAKTDFATLAKQYSDDPAAKTNGGDLGWVTVFSLPYELENLAYATPVGKTSAVYQSRSGYHIFKNLGERKAVGRIKAAQILLAVPPNSSEADKAKIKRTADSLYARLQAGDDFGKLATSFSNDVISAASNGQMMEFAVGEYDPIFENAVLSLPKNGALSKPFLTAHGYHLVKRINLTPVPVKLDAVVKDDLVKRIEQSDRIQFSKKALAQKVVKQIGYKKLPFADAELWAYTDSVLRYQVPKIKVSLSPGSGLLKMGEHTATVSEWTSFAQANRFRADGTATRLYPQLWEEFIQATALTYYQDHLENFNEDFRRQINEFAEGNLFFEIMQREVWTPAQADSAALENYYQAHRKDYTWKESADAVMFYAANESAAKTFFNAVSKNPADWKTALTSYSEQITADSNRFELAQLPKAEKQSITAGTLTSPVINKSDNSASFAYVVQVHNKPELRNFKEARGLVINDYQTQLEQGWLAKLKQKYPVRVNEAVWKEVVQKTK